MEGYAMYPFLRILYEANMRSFHDDDDSDDYQSQSDEVIDLEFDEETKSYRMEV